MITSALEHAWWSRGAYGLEGIHYSLYSKATVLWHFGTGAWSVGGQWLGQ